MTRGRGRLRRCGLCPGERSLCSDWSAPRSRSLEDAGVLERRIHEASRYVPLDNLALSPQCGFASTAEGNLLSEEDQWAKLRLVAETSRQAWG